MANRKATFAKRQRETDLKDRARAKDARRAQKRNETPGIKGPQIAWEEAVRAVASDELPSLEMANQRGEGASEDAAGQAPAGQAPGAAPPAAAAPAAARAAPAPAAPARAAPAHAAPAPAAAGAPASSAPATSSGPAARPRAG
jgi:hypothetical protein